MGKQAEKSPDTEISGGSAGGSAGLSARDRFNAAAAELGIIGIAGVAKLLRATIDASGLPASAWAESHGISKGYISLVLSGRRIPGYSIRALLNLDELVFFRARPPNAPPLKPRKIGKPTPYYARGNRAADLLYRPKPPAPLTADVDRRALRPVRPAAGAKRAVRPSRQPKGVSP